MIQCVTIETAIINYYTYYLIGCYLNIFLMWENAQQEKKIDLLEEKNKDDLGVIRVNEIKQNITITNNVLNIGIRTQIYAAWQVIT